MSTFSEDAAHIRKLLTTAHTAADRLAADMAQPEKLQRSLTQTLGALEAATVEARCICERYLNSTKTTGGKPALPYREITGSVEMLDYHWLHITVNTLLPSTLYQTPIWFSDTVRRLLDEYESSGRPLPYFKQALMVIDEHSDITGRRAFDQDNKGYKGISNAIKGRLIPDDDQYTLGIVLLSSRSGENACHVTLMDRADAADFFSLKSGDYSI